MNTPTLKYVMIELDDGRQFIAEAPQITKAEILDKISPEDWYDHKITIRIEFTVDEIMVRKEDKDKIREYPDKPLLSDRLLLGE